MTPADPRPPRNCYKCGRQIGPDETICDVCNRAGMATPSATQYHGTIVVAIVGGRGDHGDRRQPVAARDRAVPWRGAAPGRGPPDAILVEVQVTNQGTRAGRAKCQVTARDATDMVLRIRSTVSPQVQGGATVTFTERIPGLPEAPASVVVTCA